METSGYVKVLYSFCEWTMRFVYVNLLWMSFSFLGLVLFGFFPATYAMFEVIRKWIMKETEIPIFHTFWSYYRQFFWKANLLGFVILVIGLVLYADLMFINQWIVNDLVLTGLKIIFWVICFMYLITLLYVFPVFSHYRLKLVQNIKYAFIIGMAYPAMTVVMVSGVIIIYFIMVFIPGLIPFFSGSLLCLVILWPAYQAFHKIEEHRARISEKN